MKKIMLCPKEFGNTYDMCKYIRDNSDCELKVIDGKTKIDLNEYDAIILSSGVYADNIHKNIKGWINNVDDYKEIKAKTYLFLTWIGRGKSDKAAYNKVHKLLQIKGVKLEDNYITSYGKFTRLFKGNHPNEEDKKKILNWVKKL